MTALGPLLKSSATLLADALSLDRSEARLEAQVLAAHALARDRAWLIAHERDTLSPTESEAVETLIARRTKGEPVSYILEEREFYGHRFRVTPAVLIPRSDTERLVEAALEIIPTDRPYVALDLGTGSGCIAISIALARPGCEVWAVEQSRDALEVAKENGKRLGARIRWHQGNWLQDLDAHDFNVIVANPPYIATGDPHLSQGDLRFEPNTALASGPDGLEDLRSLIFSAPRHLANDGWLMVEHGFDQGNICQSLFARQGYRNIVTLHDLAGNPRVTGGQYPGLTVGKLYA